MQLKPGDTYRCGFATSNTAGAATDADSLPTATLYRNGTLDGAVTVTVASKSVTGAYDATYTIPSGYAHGDRIQVLVAAVIGGTTAREWLPAERLVAWPTDALPNAAAGANGGVPTGNASGQVTVAGFANNAITTAAFQDGAITAAKAPNLDAAVSSRSTYAGADTAGTTTLLTRLTSQRGSNLDNLDVAVSTRLASASFIAAPTTAEVADKLLGRSIAGGADGGRTVTSALRILRNRVSRPTTSGTGTVYREDDATPDWTFTVTTDSNTVPAKEVDPS